MWNIIGMGFNEDKCKDTKINIGYYIIDSLAEIEGMPVCMPDNESRFAAIDNGELRLIKTNCNIKFIEDALLAIKGNFNTSPDKTIVIVPDASFDIGIIKVKNRGGDNGNKLIDRGINTLGHKVLRLRFGFVGLNKKEIDLYSKITPLEANIVYPQIYNAGLTLHTLVYDGYAAAIDKTTSINRKLRNP